MSGRTIALSAIGTRTSRNGRDGYVTVGAVASKRVCSAPSRCVPASEVCSPFALYLLCVCGWLLCKCIVRGYVAYVVV